jgi:hypothetical protein
MAAAFPLANAALLLYGTRHFIGFTEAANDLVYGFKELYGVLPSIRILCLVKYIKACARAFVLLVRGSAPRASEASLDNRLSFSNRPFKNEY